MGLLRPQYDLDPVLGPPPHEVLMELVKSILRPPLQILNQSSIGVSLEILPGYLAKFLQ